MIQSSLKTSKEDSFHINQTTWLHSHNKSHCQRKAVKKTLLSTDQDPKGVLPGHPSGVSRQSATRTSPYSTHITKLEDHHRLPQSTIKNRDYQDPPECNGTTNGSSRSPCKWQKAPGASQNKEEGIEYWPWNFIKYRSCYPTFWYIEGKLSYVWGCGQKQATGAEIALITISVTFVEWPPMPHTCVELIKVDPRSPVCIYCSKTNHSSAYCRYRPRDNWEEPRHTPDALKTGATGKKLALVARNQAGSTHRNV